MSDHKKYNFSVNDVSEVYAGPGGKLWELLMGEQIHVGGSEQTDFLAKKIGLDKLNGETILLDICSALGGPARQLVDEYGVKIIGLDITLEMIEEAQKRTKGIQYEGKIEYRLGSALDIPAHDESIDIVWGQDAWCYITDKERLIEETWRVLKPDGTIAFTDWIWGTSKITEEESDLLMEFMVFPSLQTLEGYKKLIKKVGYNLIESQDFGDDFANHVDEYVKILKANKENIEKGYGIELFREAEKGLLAWQKAIYEKKVSRGLWIAKKV
ncbi:MAG: methyltransferase domain-containing protein [Candidatus Lokiarchaeota archaeon]|nr:methyltransferase domain-containing protein [Candidatus Lokiarchaeota archaeon]